MGGGDCNVMEGLVTRCLGHNLIDYKLAQYEEVVHDIEPWD